MSIRKQAKRLGFEVVGKLTRKAEWEHERCERWYMDEGKNEYYTRCGILTIVTADGGVI